MAAGKTLVSQTCWGHRHGLQSSNLDSYLGSEFDALRLTRIAREKRKGTTSNRVPMLPSNEVTFAKDPAVCHSLYVPSDRIAEAFVIPVHQP